MTSHYEITERFAREAGKAEPKLLHSQRGNVKVNEYNWHELLSYGTHFVLARIMLDDNGERSWWLLNGDTYSVSTSQHQSMVRSAVKRTGLPVMIVPFSAISSSRINVKTIVPVEITADVNEEIKCKSTDLKDAPKYMRKIWSNEAADYVDREPDEDGFYRWTRYVHHLGASLFKAQYQVYDTTAKDFRQVTAFFLSAFDEQETRPLYFLAELPQGCEPATVAEAFGMLKPEEVKMAEANGKPVTRQGDIFAIPTEYTTRQLKAMGGVRPNGDRAEFNRRTYGLGKTEAYILGDSHTASDVLEVPTGQGDEYWTYARGTLRHRPGRWRNAEHKMQRMGDGKTWHLLVKNTVPEGRSWSVSGNVD